MSPHNGKPSKPVSSPPCLKPRREVTPSAGGCCEQVIPPLHPWQPFKSKKMCSKSSLINMEDCVFNDGALVPYQDLGSPLMDVCQSATCTAFLHQIGSHPILWAAIIPIYTFLSTKNANKFILPRLWPKFPTPLNWLIN